MDQYHMANSPEKYLMAQHFHSSLQQPNLDNVQAKLYATRQRNHQLAMNYFQRKYGSTNAYQEFARTHNLGQIEKVNSQAEDLKQHLQRKARQIEMSEINKYRQQQAAQNGWQYDKRVTQQSVQQFQFNKNKKQGKRSSSNNPWTQKRHPKQQKINKSKNLSNVSAESQSIVIDSIKNKQNKQSEFINEFKNYLMNKSHHEHDNMQEGFSHSLQTNKSGYGMFASTIKQSTLEKKHNGNRKQRSPSPKKQKSYQEELVKKIYKQIAGETKQTTSVQKLTLIQYLVLNKKILRVLGLTQEQLSKKIMSEHQTKSENEISLQQFLFFILKTVGKQQQIKMIKQQKRQKKIPNGCMLPQEVINRFQQIFKQLDTHTDLIVKRLQYTNKIANDPLIRKYLNTPAVYQSELDKHVTLRRVLERLQMETLLGSEQEQKTKEYIAWNQFLDYFKAGNHDRSKYDLILLVNSLKSQEKFGLFQLPDSVSEIIMQSLYKQDQGSQYFNILNLIDQIHKNPQFEHEKYSPTRGESKISGLPAESFEEVLVRMKNSAPTYMSIKQFMEYFSSRGKPIQQFQIEKNSTNLKNFSGVKVKFVEGDIIQDKKEELDGYDSDPEMYSSNVAGSPRRTGRSVKKNQGPSSTSKIQQSYFDPNLARKQFKVTIPQPFSFQERQKSKAKKVPSAIPQQNYEPFHAKPIPSAVKDPNLYQRMLEQDQKRINQRKKNSMIITLANQKPFSFMQRKTNKKTKQQRRQYAFKAKPIPWYCSVQILDKKKQLQIGRNQKIAKQAQQSLAKAKLPPRMQRDYQQKLAKKALAEQQMNKKQQKKYTVYKDPPDFDKLHRQFEQGLERKRKQNKVTHPKEFNFTKRNESRPKTANMSMTNNFMNESIKPDQSAYKKNLQPKVAANSTAKFDKLVEKRRIEMQEKRNRQQKLRKEEQQRQKIDEQLKSKLQAAAKNKQNKQKEQRQKRQQQMKEQAKNFKSWKQQRIEKGRQQPMLIERPLKRDQKIQKMRKLAQISKTLKDNGIKGKDHDSYFKREQLLLLQDWQQLKDRL